MESSRPGLYNILTMYSKFTVLTLLTAASFLILGVMRAQSESDRQYAYFSSALADAQIIEDVVIGPTPYHVESGIVSTPKGIVPQSRNALSALQTAYALTVTKRNPFFAIAGTDSIQLSQAVERLSTIQRQLAEAQDSSKEQYLVGSALYPTRFLASLADLERERVSFLESGKSTDALRYSYALLSTMESYNNNIRAFQFAFERVVNQHTATYATAQEIITRNSILKALEGYENNSSDLHTKHKKRMKCIAGHIDLCNPRDLSIPPLSKPTSQGGAPLDTSRVRDIKSLLADADTPIDLTAPVVYLLGSVCAPTTSKSAPAYTVAKRTQAQSGTQETYFIPVGDIRLIRSSQHTSVPFLAYFANHDVEYVPMRTNNHYNCIKLAEEQGRVFWILAIREFAHRSPLTTFAETQTKDTLLELEHALSGEFVSESDAYAYMTIARSLSTTHALPPHISDEIIDLILQLNNASSMFDSTVNIMAFMEEGNLTLFKQGLQTDMYAPYLFFVRSGFFGLFGGANPSISGSQYQFEPNTIPPKKQPYIYYSSLPLTTSMRDKLLHDFTFYYRLHWDTH